MEKDNIIINFPPNQKLPEGYSVVFNPDVERYFFTTPDGFESLGFSDRFSARISCLMHIIEVSIKTMGKTMGHYDCGDIRGSIRTPENLYRCAHCKKIVLRPVEKAWIPSYCEETGKIVRLVRIKHPVGRAVVLIQ